MSVVRNGIDSVVNVKELVRLYVYMYVCMYVCITCTNNVYIRYGVFLYINISMRIVS